jgi:hypothetical protein
MTELYLNGMTPQKVIRMMNNIIGRAGIKEKQHLVIREREETYGNPFCQNPDKVLYVTTTLGETTHGKSQE